MIIALVGGISANRDKFARALESSGKAQLGIFSMCNNLTLECRLKTLDDFVLRLTDVRATLSGVVLPHIKTDEEACLIRKKGGVILHLFGVPSDDIPIHKDDLLVTTKTGGERHYLDPVEALSEIIHRKHCG